MDESCNGQIRILSADGKELRRLDFIQAKTLEISTEGLPKGCHTLIRLNKNGEIKDVEKLIIK